MRAKFVQKLAQATNTSPMYWYELDQSYWYAKFRKTSRTSIKAIVPNKLKTLDLPLSPGKKLYDEFITPSNGLASRKALYGLCNKTKIDESTVKSVINGQRKINYSIARRLASGLNTSIWYWMDLQNRYEIEAIIQSKRKIPRSLKGEMELYLTDDYKELAYSNEDWKVPVLRPIEILLSKFILPTRIALSDWCRLLFLTKRNMNRLIHGKEEFSIATIAKLCLIFNTPFSYWLFLQARFYAEIPKFDFTNESKEVSTPLDVLKHYVISANWTMRGFAKHIGVDFRKLYKLSEGIIDFNSATRIGQGLNSNPEFWLKICLNQRHSHGAK